MSIIFNTKKELFLGKRPFKSKKMDKSEFCQKVDILYDELKEKYICNKDCYSTIKNKIRVVDEIVSENDEIPDFLSAYRRDRNKVIGSGACAFNYDHWSGQYAIKTLESGFTFMQIYASFEDDDLCPMYNIIYFDQNDNLRLYVPYCGNQVFVGADEAMGICGRYEEESRAIKRLFDEAQYPQTEAQARDIWDYQKDNVFWRLYAQKYGRKDNEKIQIFDFDEELMYEDIVSNCILE